jgi:hypothetical protein
VEFLEGTSGNAASSSFGTNVSKSHFEGMSNFSNVDENILIEQSKLADQKIEFLHKQIQLVEKRKKLEKLQKNEPIYNLGILEQKFNDDETNGEDDSLCILAK